MAKTPPTPVTLVGPWTLGKQALAELRRHWKLYTLIVALIEVPTNLATTYLGITAGTDTEAYLAIAGVFMEVALIYAVTRYRRGQAVITLREAYYSGSRVVLRFILVVALLAVMLLPLVVASDIYGVSASSTTPVSSGELILLGSISLILALPSFWLLGRTLLAIIAVVDNEDELRPVTAIRLAWRLTRHRYWRTLGRMLAVILWQIPIIILPIIVLGGLYVLTQNVFFVAVLQMAIAIVVLPFTMIYGFGLYDNLQATLPRSK